MLGHLDSKFRSDLALICESHHLDDINDFEKYNVEVQYGNDINEKVNLDYIAVILRIADLLHITQDRTPSISRRIINVSNPYSINEWEKQKAVKAIKPQKKRNEENIVDDTLLKDTIEITAYFDGAETAEAYFGLSAYLQYTRKELTRCNEITLNAQKTEGTRDYEFPWKYVDESKITAVGFETKKLQFTIDQDNILQLLVGHTLYNDSSVVVRELVQNGIDAVKLQLFNEEKEGKVKTEGLIYVEWKSEKHELTFWDNGTGMTITEVENFLLKVGASKYRDEDFKKEYPTFSSISHFGIGILTCFMIANDIDIMTNSDKQKEANIINLRKVNGRYLLRKEDKTELDSKIKNHGTMVKLHIRGDVDMNNLETDLRKWIVLPEIPVKLSYDDKIVKIGYNNLKDALIEYLSDLGLNVDGEKYDVVERTHGNVTLAYAIRHLTYLSDWCLINTNQIGRMIRRDKYPIGTCIEGIRVEFTTPGYKNSSILAIANIKNSKYQTNVARSAIELGANKEIISEIYDVYEEYIQEQMDDLEKKNYSMPWAVSEGQYLMEPLVFDEDYGTGRTEPIDEHVLTQRLAKLKCMIVESNGKRELVSAENVVEMESVSIIESKMTSAAESLLKEIRSDATVTDIIGIVCSQKNFLKDMENVICNYNDRNILHRYALKSKEVINIDVNREQRRIHVEYSNQADLWYKYNIKGGKKLFISKNDFKIDGLENEIGVKTLTGMYLTSTSELYKYIQKIVLLFLEDDTEENKMLLELFLSYVFNSRVLEQIFKEDMNSNKLLKQVMEESTFRVSDEMLIKIWDKIDMKEFADIVLKHTYSFYSIYDWSRNKNNT